MAANDIALISLDENGRHITITSGSRHRKVSKKQFQLLCALVDQGPSGVLTAEYLRRHLPLWKGNTANDTAGREVSRYLKGLQTDGIFIVDQPTGMTTGPWAIRPDVFGRISPEEKAAIRKLVQDWNFEAAYQFRDVELQDMVAWLSAATEAMLHLTSGDVGQSSEYARKAHEYAKHHDLVAVADVISAKVAARSNLPEPKPGKIDVEQQTVFGIAVNAQRLAAAAVGSPETEWRSYLLELRRVVGSVLSRADAATLAVLFNAMAVLCRRNKDYVEALAHIREAAPLAVLSGNLTLLQAVLFNFGHILTKIPETGRPQKELSDNVHALIGLDVAMRERHRIGVDSAQAELVLAQTNLKHDNLESARQWLNRARLIIEVSGQLQDIAFYQWTEGRILMREAKNEDERLAAAHKLKSAAQKYREIGRDSVATRIENELS